MRPARCANECRCDQSAWLSSPVQLLGYTCRTGRETDLTTLSFWGDGTTRGERGKGRNDGLQHLHQVKGQTDIGDGQ